MKPTTLFFAAAVFVSLAARSSAQHLGDIEISFNGERLVTENPGGANDRIFFNEFDDFGGTLFTDDPGFESQSGALPAGTRISFNVLQSLWYWDGEQLLDTPETASVKISLGPVSPVFVTAASGAQPGFAIATASSGGAIHTHPSYFLNPTDAPFGMYGIVLEITAPGLEPSEPFLVAFNYGLVDLEQFDAGVEAIALAAGIIAPPDIPGDTDQDGDVDLEDLNNVRNHFGESGEPVLGDTSPFDGIVDLTDLNNVRNHFGNTQTVPEPSSIVLALLAMVGLGLRSSRSR